MKVLVFDTESDGFVEKATKLWCIATVDKDTGEEKLYTPTNILAGIAALESADVIVGHGIVKHDLPLLEKLYNWKPLSHQIIVDTLIYSRMLRPKRPIPEGYEGNKPHSIEAWGYRVGLAKPDHTDWTQYSDAMGIRCMDDAKIGKLTLEELEREAETIPTYYEEIKRPRCTVS